MNDTRFNKIKPTVRYREILGTEEYSDGSYGFLIRGITGHPNLGDDYTWPIRTSSVQHVTRCPNNDIVAFETRNTLYIKEQGA